MTYEEHSKRESAGAATKTPLISVVVPCCNVEKYVAKCIESILAQTYRNLEILLVDDCSTDATLSILRSYEGKDRRIRVIARNQNGGRSECRNSGILEASGDLIAFVDGDDTLEPNAYQTIVDRYDPSIDVYWFGIKIIYESNLELKKSDDNYYRVRHSGLHAVGREDLLDYDCSVCNKVFRRSVLGDEFLFKGLYYEDALFFMKFFALPRKIYFFPEKLYDYYRHPTSIMASTFGRTEGLAVHHLYILDDLYDFWRLHGFLLESRIAFQRLAATYFWLAFNHCQPYEKAGIVAEMVVRLRKWNIGSEANPVLDYIKNGEYGVTFGPVPPEQPVVALPPLKGMQKLFAIRNENGHQIVRVLTKKVASRKVKSVGRSASGKPDAAAGRTGSRGR